MPEKWDQIKQLFTLALERNPEERSEFLRVACAGDDFMRSEVESLLSSYDENTGFLEDCPAATLQSRFMTGRRIGAYRILGECGHGGMAVVYLSERDDQQYRKRVAIKMVKAGYNSDDILRRFYNERQTLATLDHPNIVRLLDGGSTEDGRPYLVMDFVEGLPILEYCDLHRVTIRERLRLFCSVCAAVQYAHNKFVIHRDLKSRNVLITNDGIPRLLDFGIAKLLNPECAQTLPQTQTHWRPMTPEYASPEQLRGELVTNATDIYSLGVLLYELLTGHRPYPAHHSLFELERLVWEEEPESPSSGISRSEEIVQDDGSRIAITPELVSQARGVRPVELRRQLRGDLDTIVLKALRKEPPLRYLSAKEFSEDIERHLTGLPVRARKPTFFYRTGRFLRRHRESLATAGMVLALTGALGTWQARKIWKHPSTEVNARPSIAILGFKNLSNSSEAAWLSTAFSEILTSELAAGEKLRTVPGETVARTKIDLGLLEAESLDSATAQRLRKNLDIDFVVLGSYLDSAGGQVRLDVRVQGTARAETIATVSEIGSETQLTDLVVHAGRRLRQDLGIRELSPAESAAIEASVPSNPKAMRLYAQGLAKLRAFDTLAARDVLERAVAADQSYPLAHSALAQTWLALGYEPKAQREAKRAVALAGNLSREDRLVVEGRYYEASKQREKAIETYRTLFSFFPDNLQYGLYLGKALVAGEHGPDALNLVTQLRKLAEPEGDDPQIDLVRAEAAAQLSDNEGAVGAAETAARKAAASGAKLLVGRARSFQCRAFANLGKPQESRKACEEARRTYEEAGDLAGVARALHAMGEVPLNQGNLDQAKEVYDQALSITRKIGDKKGEGRELGNIALIYSQLGDFATANKIYREALAISRETGNKHDVAVDMGNIGDVLHAEGRLREALAEYQAALALTREVGFKSSEAIDIQLIGDVLADLGDLNGARRMYEQALPIQRDIGERSYYAGTLVSVGNVLRQKGDLNGAKRAYEEALSIRQQLGEKGSEAESQLPLSELYCDLGQAAVAEKMAEAAAQEFRAEKETNYEILAETVLSRSLLQQGKIEDAQRTMARALRLSEKSKAVTVRLPLKIQNAYVRAAAKDPAGSEQAARSALAAATHFGFTRFRFEASLALGEIQMRGKSRRAGRARLEELIRAAQSKGFELIARKALAELNT